MTTLNAVMLIFLQWAGYLLVFAIALHLVAHYAMKVIEHHHKIKGATQMALAIQAEGGDETLNALLAKAHAKAEAERARDGAKR